MKLKDEAVELMSSSGLRINKGFTYEKVEEAVLQFKKALIQNKDDILLEYYMKIFGDFKK